MTISMLKVGLAGAIALTAFAPAALANVAISTDRVQLQVGNNGQIYIRNLPARPTALPQVTIPPVGSRLIRPTATFAPACTARSHSTQSRSTALGNVIYSENRSTTRVCQ